MKILFIGSVIFSSEILKTLILKKINIIGIITKKKSVFNTDHYNLAPLAKKITSLTNTIKILTLQKVLIG